MSAFLTLLHQDHANYLHLVNAFETQVNVAADGGRPSFHILRGVISYFKVYSQRIHHPREEMLLSLLKTRAPELSAQVNEIVESHRHISDRLTGLEELLDAFEKNAVAGERAFVDAAREFISFERAHISQEDTHLIPAAIHHLTVAEWKWADSSLGDEKDPISGQAAIAPLAQMRESIFNTDNQAQRREI